MDPDAAVSALVRAVECDETVLSVADIDWARFAPGFTAARPNALLSELPEVQAALRELEAGRGSERSGSDLAGRLAALPEADRESAVLRAVQAHAAAILGHRDPSVVAPQAAFTEQGFDSMTAVQLRNALAKDFGLRLPTTLIFDYPTPLALSRFVVGEVMGAAGGQPDAVAATQVSDEPIAIVGMACRYPGGVDSPEDLWELVAEGRGRDRPTSRPTAAGTSTASTTPTPTIPGTSYARSGGFLDAGDGFDPALLRDQAARGAGDGPAAAPVAGGRVGGVRGRRDRPASAARQPDRRVRRA